MTGRAVRPALPLGHLDGELAGRPARYLTLSPGSCGRFKDLGRRGPGASLSRVIGRLRLASAFTTVVGRDDGA